MKATISKYWAVFRIAFRASVFFKNKMLAQAFIQLFRITILMSVYSFVFKTLQVSGTITLQIAVWSIAAYFCLLSIRFRNLFNEINADITSGNIEVILSRPVNYLAYRIINQVGGDFSSFLIPVCGCFILLPPLIGFPELTITPLYIIGVIAVTVLGVIVGALMYSLVGFAAFWIEDATPVYWLVDKGVLLLGGSYLPVAFYPEFMQMLAQYSPFGASMFISHIFYSDFLEKLPILLLSQLFWIVILYIAVTLVFRKAVRRLNVNGG